MGRYFVLRHDRPSSHWITTIAPPAAKHETEHRKREENERIVNKKPDEPLESSWFMNDPFRKTKGDGESRSGWQHSARFKTEFSR